MCAPLIIGVIGCLFVFLAQAEPPHASAAIQLLKSLTRPQLVNEGDTALLIAPDGSLWAWGGNELGLMGVFPKELFTETPLRVGLDSDWKQVDNFGIATLALKQDGSLWGWGWYYRNFTNLINHAPVPTRIGTETNWSQISEGGANLALKDDGSLWGWGGNYYAQVGDGTTEYRSSPVQIGSGRDWRKVKALGETSFGLKRDGTLWSWGDFHGDRRFQSTPKILMAGTTWSDFSACGGWNVGGTTLFALKSDGTIWLNSLSVSAVAAASIPSKSEDLTQISEAKDWDKVYAGDKSVFAHKKDGSWWVCGKNWAGQLGLGTNIASVATFQRLPFSIQPAVLAAGAGTTLLLDREGRLWSWGNRLGSMQNSSDDSYKVDLKPHLIWKCLLEAK
jgi:alpha-tubulin suppressor-like RCC1 family protein